MHEKQIQPLPLFHARLPGQTLPAVPGQTSPAFPGQTLPAVPVTSAFLRLGHVVVLVMQTKLKPHNSTVMKEKLYTTCKKTLNHRAIHTSYSTSIDLTTASISLSTVGILFCPTYVRKLKEPLSGFLMETDHPQQKQLEPFTPHANGEPLLSGAPHIHSDIPELSVVQVFSFIWCSHGVVMDVPLVAPLSHSCPTIPLVVPLSQLAVPLSQLAVPLVPLAVTLAVPLSH